MSAHISYDHDRDGAHSTARLDARLCHLLGRIFHVGSSVRLHSHPSKPTGYGRLNNEELVPLFRIGLNTTVEGETGLLNRLC